MTDVQKVFANVLDKEEKYVKYIDPFMVAVADKIQKTFSEYVGRPLTTERRNELVEKFKATLREILLGKPKISKDGNQEDLRCLKINVAPPRKSAHTPLDIELAQQQNFKKGFNTIRAISSMKPNAPHASWHSIVENGERDD